MPAPESQGISVIDGHQVESTWKANTIRVAQYGGDFNVIQDAIDYANAIGGDWTIEVYTSTWNEGDITHTGPANITLKGMGEGRVTIAPTAIPTTAVIVSSGVLSLEDIIVTSPDATRPVIRVTAGTFGATSCEFNGVGAGDALQQVGGTVELHDCRVPVGDIDLRDAPCTITIEDCNINGTVDTSDGVGVGVVMTVTVGHCDCNNQAFNLAATGACVYEFRSNNEMGTITDASLGAGAVNGHICRCHIAGAGLVKNGTTGWLTDGSALIAISNTNAVGGVIVYGGIIVSITRAVGSVVWWQDLNTLKVIPCATITDTIIGWALAAAGAGDVILIHPGIYDEAVTCIAGVDIKGVGPASGVIIYQLNANIVTLANNVHIDNLTVRLGTPTGERHLIQDNAVACTARLSNLILEITAPTNIANLMVFYFTGAGNYIIERCFFDITYTGAAVGHGVHTSTNAATLHLIDNDFTYNANTAAIHVFSAVASTIIGGGNRWAGTGHLFGVVLGTITLDNESVVCSGMVAGDVSGGTVLLRTDMNSYEVFTGMNPNHAVAANRYIYLHPGTHTLAASLLSAVSNLTIQGAGRQTIVTTTTDDLDIIFMQNATNIILRDFVVRGFETGAMNDLGISWLNIDDSKIINVWVEHCGEFGIYMSGCDRCELEGVTCYSNALGGFWIRTCTWCRFISPKAHENEDYGFWLDDSSDDCELIAPTAYHNGLSGSFPGIMVDSSDRVIVTAGQCDSNTGHGLHIFRSDNCTIGGGGQYNNNGGDGVNIEGDATENADYNTISVISATGNTSDGVEILQAGAGQANKNIVTSCQLLGNTGLALNDGGTNTEQGHNIVV